MQLLYNSLACDTAHGSLLSVLFSRNSSLIFTYIFSKRSSNHELIKLLSGIGCSSCHFPHAYLEKNWTLKCGDKDRIVFVHESLNTSCVPLHDIEKYTSYILRNSEAYAIDMYSQ